MQKLRNKWIIRNTQNNVHNRSNVALPTIRITRDTPSLLTGLRQECQLNISTLVFIFSRTGPRYLPTYFSFEYFITYVFL